MFAHSFGEGSAVQNEQGYYLVVETSPFRHWHILASFDLFSFPWKKYRIDVYKRQVLSFGGAGINVVCGHFFCISCKIPDSVATIYVFSGWFTAYFSSCLLYTSDSNVILSV